MAIQNVIINQIIKGDNIDMDSTNDRGIWSILIKVMLLGGVSLHIACIFLAMFNTNGNLYNILKVLGTFLITGGIISLIVLTKKRKELKINKMQFICIILFLLCFLIIHVIYIFGNQIMKNVSMLILGLLFFIEGFFFYKYFIKR